MHLPDYNAGHAAIAATPPQAPAARRSGRCRCAFLRRLDAGEPAGPACDRASACHSSDAPVRIESISVDGSICDAKCGSSLPRNLPAHRAGLRCCAAVGGRALDHEQVERLLLAVHDQDREHCAEHGLPKGVTVFYRASHAANPSWVINGVVARFTRRRRNQHQRSN